jgi:uncharacterized membrane protein
MRKRRSSNQSSGRNPNYKGKSPRNDVGDKPSNSSDNKRSANNNFNRSKSRSILPEPSVLQEYEYALDGAADRIIKMAEDEQKRRHEWEEKYLKHYRKSKRIGQLFGFFLLAFVILAVVVLSSMGKDETARILGITAFASVAAAVILGGLARKRPIKKRRK